MTLVRVEWRKMRRLKVGWLLALMVLIVVGWPQAASAASAQEADSATILLGLGMIASLVGPLFMAIIASRVVDMEHTAAGWTLYGTIGTGFSRLLLAKMAALAPLVAVAVVVEVALVALLVPGGIDAPGHWLMYLAGLILVNGVFLAGHVVLAAVTDNQLISIGAGALGSFIALFCLFLPVWMARLVPWGYYAMIIPATVSDGDEAGIHYVMPDWLTILGAAALSLVVLTVVLRRLNSTKEN